MILPAIYQHHPFPFLYYCTSWFFLQSINIILFLFLYYCTSWFFLQSINIILFLFLYYCTSWFFLQSINIIFFLFSGFIMYATFSRYFVCNNRVTQNIWDFRDDCMEFILFVSFNYGSVELLIWIFFAISFIMPAKDKILEINFPKKLSNPNSFRWSLQYHSLWVTLSLRPRPMPWELPLRRWKKLCYSSLMNIFQWSCLERWQCPLRCWLFKSEVIQN